MSYFLPSSVQKRLLRYALSRVELLDTDALNLDRLEVDWGRRSTVELKDVGLLKDKLTSLCEIPEYLKLEHASIALLRITIPADIHTSAINIQIEGIEARLRLLDDIRSTKPTPKKKSEDKFSSAGNKRSKREVQFSSLRSSIPQEGSTLSSDDEEDRLPTVHDLAASFLAEGFAEEKDELEAAFISQSTADLKQSIISTGSGDEDTNVGTGIDIGLPAFLAAFLKGIGDRLQIQIRNVTIKVEAGMISNAEPVMNSILESGRSLTTVVISVEEIDVHEVVLFGADVDKSDGERRQVDLVNGTNSGNLNEKRRITLKNVFASILSDAELIPPSSPVLERKVAEGQPAKSVEISVSEVDPPTPVVEPTQSSISLSVESSGIPEQVEDNTVGTRQGVSDASSDEQYYLNTESLGNSFALSSHHQDNPSQLDNDGTASANNERLISELEEAIEQSVAYSKLANTDVVHELADNSSGNYSEQLHNSLEICRKEKSLSTSSSTLRSRGRLSRSQSPQKLAATLSQPSRPLAESFQAYQSHSRNSENFESTTIDTSTTENINMKTSQPHGIEDSLTQSLMFSHEEAKSIYMSVVDEQHTSASRSLHIPGAWDETDEADLSYGIQFSKGTEACFSDAGNQLHGNGLDQGMKDNPLRSTTKIEPEQYLPALVTSASEQRKPKDDTYDEFDSHSASLPMLSRVFLRVDEAEIWISSTITRRENCDVSPTSSPKDSRALDRTEQHHLPGSFSSYAESKTSLHGSGFVPCSASERSKKSRGQQEHSRSTEMKTESLYELVLRSVKAKCDMPVSRVLVELVRKVQYASEQTVHQLSAKTSKKTGFNNPPSHSSRFVLRLDNMKLEFLETLESQIINTASDVGNEQSNSTTESPLFILKATDIECCSINTPAPQSKLEIGKLTFGFNDENIVSFSKTSKIRTSMRDLQSPSSRDITITFAQVKNTTEINVNTKPLQICLDLQRLDNTLGSMGGLSGLMELGNSATSESTIVAPPSKSGQRFRGVHFEEILPSNNKQKSLPKPRFNIRIGGTAIFVRGKDCGVKLNSTAVKLVSRDAIIGLQVDDVRLTGPHANTQLKEASISVRLRNTSLKYLLLPEEHDLTRLISLLTPSKDKFEDDDDFLVDTLIRQRRKGSVLRTNISKLEFKIQDISTIKIIEDLIDEATKLSSVTKYLPEESRPGLMTLGTIEHAVIEVQTNHRVGFIAVELKTAEFAHITLPSLVAVSFNKIAIDRNETTAIVTEVLPLKAHDQPPMLMARMIGDELEPTVKLKLWNICFEYSVPLIMALLDIPDGGTQVNGSIDLNASIAALVESHFLLKNNPRTGAGSQQSVSNSKPLAMNLALRDCAIGMTPRNMPSKALFVVIDGCFSGSLPDNERFDMAIELRKAGLLIIDDSRKLLSTTELSLETRAPPSVAASNHIPDLCSLGFVSVSTISAATVVVKLTYGLQDGEDTWEIDFKDELFLLETCADSTQTLLETLHALKPPFPPSKGQKYRTEITPMQDMMESFSGDAFVAPNLHDRRGLGLDDVSDEELASEFDDLSDFTDLDMNVNPVLREKLRGYSSAHLRTLGLAGLQSNRPEHTPTEQTFKGARMGGGTNMRGVGKKWDSNNNRYVPVDSKELASSPIKVKIRDVHVIWHLFDGYDWERTRDTIAKAVQDVEAKAEERRVGRRFDEEDDKESVIGDFLFNSIYIGIPVNQDPRELTRQINRNLDDHVSETASHVSTVNSRPSSSHRTPRNQGRKLKLDRSKRHKVAFELRGISVDVFGFTPGGETQTSIDLRVADFEIFDHVPTSTWKKFATYMHDAGPRDEQKPMVHLEICDVKPVPELTATELVIRVTVLPVRLHVDQDALDFITRFFDFQDDSQKGNGPPAEQPYLQRVEVRAVPIKLDYKPKKVDYAGLRSGRTTEFVNFFILDGAEMVLKHTIIYGTSGFLKLHKSLEDVWMPDVRRNQLPKVLSGLNGVRTLVNVGSGFRDLVVIPVREYKKDGRLVRSISKGALAFAKQTGGELTRFGAKLAIGAQTALQGAEDFFEKPRHPLSSGGGTGNEFGWEGGDVDDDERRAISHYANQPAGILQGLKGAARSLERDLLFTKDVIIAVSGEMRESKTAEGAARAVVRHAPTLILRPMIGASKAISQTLMGATNTVDPQNRRRVEDKYKRY